MRRGWIFGMGLGLMATVVICAESAAAVITNKYRFVPKSSRSFESAPGEGWPFRADLEGSFSLSYDTESGNAWLTDHDTRLTAATRDHLSFPMIASDPNGPATAEALRQAALQQLANEVNGTALADYSDWLSMTGTKQSEGQFEFGEIWTELPPGTSEWLAGRFSMYQPFYKDSISASLMLSEDGSEGTISGSNLFLEFVCGPKYFLDAAFVLDNSLVFAVPEPTSGALLIGAVATGTMLVWRRYRTRLSSM